VKRLPYITQERTMPRTSASWCKALPSFAHFICEKSRKYAINFKEVMHIWMS
jgi:hypothetical protein